MIVESNFPCDQLCLFLLENDLAFSNPLSEQLRKSNGLTIEEYAKKLSALATIAVEYDHKAIKGAVIGYTRNLPETNCSYITQVVTSLKYRRQGVCARLLREYITYCSRRNINEVWLTTGEKNYAARKTYENSGFQLAESEKTGIVKYIYKLK